MLSTNNELGTCDPVEIEAFLPWRLLEIPAALLGLDLVKADVVCVSCSGSGGYHYPGCLAASACVGAHSEHQMDGDHGISWLNTTAKPVPIWNQDEWNKRVAKWRSPDLRKQLRTPSIKSILAAHRRALRSP